MSSQNSTSSYSWGSSEQPHNTEYIAPQILKILNVLGVTRVVDLGAGNGALCRKMRDLNYDVVGVDQSPEGVRIAGDYCPGVSFYNLDVTGDPSVLIDKEGLFDVAVSTEVVEHLYSPHKLIQYAYAVVKPGGYFIISTPYHGYLKNLALALTGKSDSHFTALWHGGHVKFWSRKTLSQLLKDNGFEVLEFCGVGRGWFFWKSMVLVAKSVSVD